VYIGFNVRAHASERVQIFGRENAGVDSAARLSARAVRGAAGSRVRAPRINRRRLRI